MKKEQSSEKPRRLLNKSDLIILGIGLAVCAVLMVFPRNTTGAVCNVYHKGELIHSAPLETSGTYTPPEAPGVLILFDGEGASFAQSDCPDLTCVHMGVIKQNGQTSMCLPNQIVIKIESARNSEEPDTIAY